MENKEELELLRQYFYNDKDDCKGKNNSLKERILEIQKQNKLIDKIEKFARVITEDQLSDFNEILKELGIL